MDTPCATVADAGAAIEGAPFTVTATVCVPAVLPNPSLAFTVRLSVPGVPLVSPRLASAMFTWVSVPVKVSLAVPPPLSPAPPALLVVSEPCVSETVTVKVSVSVLPLSETAIPAMGARWLTPITAAPGTAMTGPLATDTAIEPVPMLPRLSDAVSEIVSLVSVPSVTLRVASSALTSVSNPPIVRFTPAADTEPPPDAVAESTPCVSASTTENLSPVVTPDSLRLTGVMAKGLAMPTVTDPGAARVGVPLIVSATEPLAVLPNPSFPPRWIVSVPPADSRSVKVASAAFTCTNVPEILRPTLPPPVTIAPPATLADSRPVVSVTVTVSGSPAVRPLSLMLTPPMAATWVTPMTCGEVARTDGRPLTVTTVVLMPAVLPNPSVAFTVMLSANSELSVSLRLASVAFTPASVPLTIRLFGTPPTVAPTAAVADSSPLVSATVTVKISPATAPVSETAIPVIGLGCPTPTVALAGAASTGPFATATAIDALAPLPRVSVAVSPIVSAAVLASVSLNVPSAAFTCPRDPKIVRVVPEPDTLAPPTLLADRTPLVSVNTTLKVSPVVVPVSDRLTPAIAPGLPTPRANVVGAAITGAPFTVTMLDAAIAVLVNPSVALITMVSPAVEVFLSVSELKADPTCAKLPLIVTKLEPLPLIEGPNPVPTESRPAVSVSVTEIVSPVVLPDSETPKPLSAAV